MMGQVISLKRGFNQILEEQEPKQEKKRRLKGQGSVYLRGGTYWIQYRADGKVYNESAKTDKKMEAIEYSGRFRHANPIDSAILFRSIAPSHSGAFRHPL